MTVQRISDLQILKTLLNKVKDSIDKQDSGLLSKGYSALENLANVEITGIEKIESLKNESSLFESAPVGLIKLDKALRITLLNNTALGFLNSSHLWTNDTQKNRFLGKSFTSSLISGVQLFLNWIHEGCQGELEVTLFGLNHNHEVLLHGVLLDTTNARHYLISLTPIQKQIQFRNRLKKYKQVFNLIGNAALLIDKKGVIQDINRAMLTLTGYSERDLLDKCADCLLSSSRDKTFSTLQSIMNDEDNWVLEVNINTYDNKQITELVKISTIRNKHNRFECYILLFQDISSVMIEQDRLERLANMDALTSVYNRLYFNQVFEEKTREAQRQGSQLVLFFLDLDKFKSLNDNYGHQYGDELLLKFAQRIKSQVRKNDLVARLGGDEFAIIMEGEIPFVAIKSFVDKIAIHLNQPYQLKDIQYSVTTSIGISRYPEDALTVEELFKNADEAMYAAKKNSQNSYQFFDKKMEKKVIAQKQLETDVEMASKSRGLELYFQPQNNLHSGEITGFEALARIHNSLNQIVQPDHFIPEAERTGLIIPLGKQILSKAFHTMNVWKKRGVNLPISVNISALQLKDNSTILHIHNLIKVFPKCVPFIHLELTETFFIEQSPDIASMIENLTAKGLEVVLDDFGTGYSSIYSLKKFPFKSIKIDKSFIQNIGNGKKDDEKILKAMLKLIKILDISVIAEGVETEKQINFLLENGCESGQGFYFSKPMPASEVIKFLNRQKFK